MCRLDHLPWDFLEYSGLAEKKEGDKHIWTEGLFQVLFPFLRETVLRTYFKFIFAGLPLCGVQPVRRRVRRAEDRASRGGAERGDQRFGIQRENDIRLGCFPNLIFAGIPGGNAGTERKKKEKGPKSKKKKRAPEAFAEVRET